MGLATIPAHASKIIAATDYLEYSLLKVVGDACIDNIKNLKTHPD